MGKPSEGIHSHWGGGINGSAAPQSNQTLLGRFPKKKPRAPSPGLTLHSPSLLRDLVVRKVDHPDRGDAVIKDKNNLLHSCHRAGVEQKQ